MNRWRRNHIENLVTRLLFEGRMSKEAAGCDVTDILNQEKFEFEKEEIKRAYVAFVLPLIYVCLPLN